MSASRVSAVRCPRRAAALCAALALSVAPALADWTQFGGPHCDFTVDAKGLASEWPADGPKKLWSRELGPGYSAIVADSDRVYTMYRAGDEEIVIALNAKDGTTAWEHRYHAPVEGAGYEREFGTGPNATPLLLPDRIVTVGFTGTMHCLDKQTGQPLWKVELWKELRGTFLKFGYSSSPILYKGKIIALVGSQGASIVGIEPKDGSIAWGDNDFENSYGTPTIINVDGQDQLVAPMATEIVGVNPESGELLWRFPHRNEWKQNVCVPIFGPDNILFISAEGPPGSKGLRLTRKDGKTQVEEAWATRKVSIHHGNAIRVGDCVFAVAGGRTAFFSALDAKTGDLIWKERGFSKATFIYGDGKFILLDEDGTLALATATREGLKVLSQVELLDKVAWTVPTLNGTTLYVRDKKTIMALDLKGS
jgi:outer membrane protein assembly factor BamB